MINHIMVAFDESDNSKRAFELAIDLAKKYNSDIRIVTCVPSPLNNDPILGANYAQVLKIIEQNGTVSISKLESRLNDLKIPCKTAVLIGLSVTDELLSYAESQGIDLIVMGSRGLGGFKKLLLGSVTSGVSQHSKCPVLIVK